MMIGEKTIQIVTSYMFISLFILFVIYIYYPCVVVLVLYMICENIGGNQISIKLLIWIEYDGKGVYMGGNENNDGGWGN